MASGHDPHVVCPGRRPLFTRDRRLGCHGKHGISVLVQMYISHVVGTSRAWPGLELRCVACLILFPNSGFAGIDKSKAPLVLLSPPLGLCYSPG